MQRDTWKRVHAELTRLARSKGAYDAEEARWLLEGKRVRVHEPLGYGSFLSYLEHVFGYGSRFASERLRVAEAIAELPAMAAALATGELCWSAVRELTRVAVPATEAEWIAAARGRSMREVEEMVSGRRSGDRPGDPVDPAMEREVLRLEVTGDALAAFREARRRIELEVGHSLDDDTFVRMLAHQALGGPTDPGRAAYQVAMTVCPQCRRGTRDGAGRELPVEPHVVEATLCDAPTRDLVRLAGASTERLGASDAGRAGCPCGGRRPRRCHRCAATGRLLCGRGTPGCRGRVVGCRRRRDAAARGPLAPASAGTGHARVRTETGLPIARPSRRVVRPRFGSTVRIRPGADSVADRRRRSPLAYARSAITVVSPLDRRVRGGPADLERLP